MGGKQGEEIESLGAQRTECVDRKGRSNPDKASRLLVHEFQHDLSRRTRIDHGDVVSDGTLTPCRSMSQVSRLNGHGRSSHITGRHKTGPYEKHFALLPVCSVHYQ